jgi:hypothetical protein
VKHWLRDWRRGFTDADMVALRAKLAAVTDITAPLHITRRERKALSLIIRGLAFDLYRSSDGLM